jgi:ribose transport system permease protein
VLFILVMAVLLPTVMGDFVDLSLGSSLGMSAMTLAVLNVQHHVPVLLACLAGIGAAVAVGLVNVFFVVFFDNNPFIVTLGMMSIVQGIIYIICGNNDVGIVSGNLSAWVFDNDFLSIPLEFYYGLAIFLIVWYVLSFTPVGQKALVIGQSREVARLTGVRVNRQRSWAFVLAAGIAGIAGIAYAATNGTVDPGAGSALILPAYAGVFLGSTAIKPGRINPLGALIAVYFLATGTAGLELLGAQSYYQQIFYGVALVAAITIPKANRDRFLRRKRAA